MLCVERLAIGVVMLRVRGARAALVGLMFMQEQLTVPLACNMTMSGELRWGGSSNFAYAQHQRSTTRLFLLQLPASILLLHFITAVILYLAGTVVSRDH